MIRLARLPEQITQYLVVRYPPDRADRPGEWLCLLTPGSSSRSILRDRLFLHDSPPNLTAFSAIADGAGWGR